MPKKCLECYKYPNFNFENMKSLYCFDHKKDNMIDVVHRKCSEKECNKQPSFNFENKTISLYCFDHKKDGMTNVKNKRCLKNDCNKRASYNIKGYKALYCNEQKEYNMFNVEKKKYLKVFNYKSKKKECLECKITIFSNIYKGYCPLCYVYKFPNKSIM
jgi:hypothetical protein